MLRGFRWQLVALLMAVVLFVAALLTRTSQPPTPTPTQELQPAPPTLDVTEAAVEATASAAAATPLPLPTVDATPSTNATPIPSTNVSVSDGVVTYREALVGEVQRLNPLLAPLNPVDADITSLIFEGLTRTNQYGEPEAALARDWVISSDGLEYVVTLREDVLWQDGVPFTADDVMYTMSLLRSADFPGPAELGAFWRTIETEKLGSNLIRFRLTQPLGSFLDALQIGILPEHALRGTTAAQIATHPFNLTPIGTGPYQLEAVRASGGSIDAVDLRVSPNFRLRAEAQTGYALERMSFRLYNSFDEAVVALQNGDVDALAAQNNSQRPALLGTMSNIHTKLGPILGALIFNWASEETSFFREQRVRIALETGLDRTSLVERHLLNTAVQADSPILPGSWAYAANLESPVPDPAAARQMLAPLAEQVATAVAESTEEAPSTTVFDFSILTPDTPALVNVANELAAQWDQYNIGVSVEAVGLTDEYHERLEAGTFDAALVELSLGDSADPDVYPFWHQGQYPDGTNYGGLNDSRISEVLERARRDPSGINRAQLYTQFQHDFVERAIAIPLYYPLYTYATALNVTGVQLGFIGASSDRFRNIQDWSFAPQS